MLPNSLRLIVPCIGLLLATGAPAQDLKIQVDYTTVAVPLDQALRHISDISKTKLWAEGDLAQEPVILRLNHVPLDDAMKHLATNLNAEWVPEKGGYSLARSTGLIAKLQAKVIAKRAAAISADIDKRLKTAEAAGPWTKERINQLAQDVTNVDNLPEEDSQRAYELDLALKPRLPDFVAFLHILKAMDAKELAAVEPGDRVAFSNLPGRMQRRLPSDILLAYPDWAAQHDALAAAIQAHGVKAVNHDLYDSEDSALRPLTGKLARVTVIAKRPYNADVIELNMVGFDEQNTPLVCADAFLAATDFGDLDTENTVWRPKPVAGEKPYDLSDVSQQLLSSDIYKKGAQGTLRSILLDPTNHDPLSLFVSEALLETATTENKDLVACPDDMLFQMVLQFQCTPKPDSPYTKSFLWSLGRFSKTDFNEDESWISVSPSDPLSASSLRANRRALGAYEMAVDQKGYSAIDDRAEAAASYQTATEPSLFGVYSSLLKAPSSFASVDLLRLYSALGPSLVNRAEHVSPIKVGELDASQLGQLDNYIYRHDVATSVTLETPHAQRRAMEEPTEVWPGGLPPDGTISISEQRQNVYNCFFEFDGDLRSQTMELSQLAVSMARAQTDPDSHQFVAKAVQPCTSRDVTFGIHFGKTQQRDLLHELAPAGEKWAMGSLPPDLQHKLDQQVAQYIQGVSNKATLPATPAPPPSRY